MRIRTQSIIKDSEVQLQQLKKKSTIGDLGIQLQ